ncbi:MAG: HD domain-containing protein [Bacilli bacterium]|nr:HD domain-containing protein [Bacilli bacterium]
MDYPKFKDLKVGDNNLEILALVTDCKVRQTVNQTPYYGLMISDGENLSDARIWTVNLVNELAEKEIKVGTVYKMIIKVNEYGGKNQIIINRIEDVALTPEEQAKFYRSAPLSIEELKQGIKEYVSKISNPVLRSVVAKLINESADKFFTHPAAMTMHHNYINGLVYHTYSMLKIAEVCLLNYPALNKDLLFSGILIHDIGKTIEISDSKIPTYSIQGNLLGHIVIGLQMLHEAAKELNVLNTEEVLALEHMIAAHHGELEYGSPKEPLIMEAQLLFYIDLLDSKMAGINAEVSKTDAGSTTNPIPTLSRKSLYVPNIK